MTPTRRTRQKITRPDKYCESCGKRIAPGRHGRRRYCNAACKQAAWRARHVTLAIGESNKQEA